MNVAKWNLWLQLQIILMVQQNNVDLDKFFCTRKKPYVNKNLCHSSTLWSQLNYFSTTTFKSLKSFEEKIWTLQGINLNIKFIGKYFKSRDHNFAELWKAGWLDRAVLEIEHVSRRNNGKHINPIQAEILKKNAVPNME